MFILLIIKEIKNKCSLESSKRTFINLKSKHARFLRNVPLRTWGEVIWFTPEMQP